MNNLEIIFKCGCDNSKQQNYNKHADKHLKTTLAVKQTFSKKIITLSRL